ncbi:hypothetical protein EYF80_053640 [Liparis tanakae]|uniref:Secreted protein n=1 Tax=Liparis tanakae TaxID=230148 RepID=A0A4Z2F516_9TELE|nr:hypothetical protein EYF80_053640 [Liparis tanakae]
MKRQPPVSACVLRLLLLAAEARSLPIHHGGIVAAFLQQLLVAALLHQHPFLEEDYVVGLLHDVHLVGYQQHGAVVGFAQQRFAHLF